MKKLKILIEGYAKENSDGTIYASPTTTLIESKGKKILVDPGAEFVEIEGLDPKYYQFFDYEVWRLRNDIK
ncbi:hypothetical protein GF357_04595 [Candidatus Dojkabacteria bacterium]|nr:hypothetical protein [Candidatus Dojkabacteria bacterium]